MSVFDDHLHNLMLPYAKAGNCTLLMLRQVGGGLLATNLETGWLEVPDWGIEAHWRVAVQARCSVPRAASVVQPSWHQHSDPL